MTSASEGGENTRKSFAPSWPTMIAAVLALLSIYIIQRIGSERIWSVQVIDYTVRGVLITLAAVFATFVVIRLVWPQAASVRQWWSEIKTVAGGFVLLLTLYVAYGTYRNQLRQASEIALSANGSNMLALEMANPKIRCLYYNYRQEDPVACLDRLAQNPDDWSFAIFYVEEVWFALQTAITERQDWGSEYAINISYWAQDVGRDPTGLFSYYVVSTEPSLEAAQNAVRSGGVQIVDLCGNYLRVWAALGRHNAQPRKISRAAAECAQKSRI